QRIAMDKELTVTVPVVLKGEAEGVKTEGGILEQLLRGIEVECLPADIPKSIEVDISHLVFGVEVRVKDLPHSEKLKFLTDENQMIAHITTVKEEVVAAPEVVAEEAAAPAEPEVIKKGKQEVEGEGEAEAVPRPRASPRRPKRPRRKRKNSYELRASSYELRANSQQRKANPCETDRRFGQPWNRVPVHAAQSRVLDDRPDRQQPR